MTAQNIKHSFIPGDDWLYFQIYSGETTADRLLKTHLTSFIEELKRNNWIKKWFFIRYSHPDFHIRLRLELVDSSRVGDVIILLNSYIKPEFEQDLVSKITIETYQREVQRYLQEAIVYSEELFYLNSEVCKDFFARESDPGDTERIYFGLWHLNVMLNYFDLELNQKIKLVDSYSEDYLKEFRTDRFLKKQLGYKYGIHFEKMKEIFKDGLGKDAAVKSEFFDIVAPTADAYELSASKILKTEQFEEQMKLGVIKSHMHMYMNRLFNTQQRKYELVLYYFLARYFHYEQAMQRKKKATSG